ncbi:MAG TPA: hypothetical protein VND93_17520 [Myxococcales bacterium]|jgi:hypothetical protein|nr:hypothetical protein [Myxococcales bacterium]
MRRSGLPWLAGTGAIVLGALWIAIGCDRSDTGVIVDQPDPGLESCGGTDGGGGTDAGTGRDGGTAADGGSDGGTGIIIPGAAGWAFYGPESGAPLRVWGVSSDQGGNLWVAGGDQGLFLLRPGSTQFECFTIANGLTPYVDDTGPHQQSVVSVAGGPAGVVYAGYQGHFAGHEDADPLYMIRSGDADKVTLAPGGISVQHIDIRTPPGVSSSPDAINGRDKIRTVWRILYDRATGNVWFGGNHGVAMWEAQTQMVFEHQHAAINSCGADGHCTLLSGDWYGIARDAAGDLWMGGGHRLAKLQYTNAQRFWGPLSPIIDVWPDASGTSRTDDYVQDLAMSGSTLWVGSITNGLAAVDATGAHPVPLALPGYRTKITSLEADPQDGSLWVGLQWGGMARMSGGTVSVYSDKVFGRQLIDWPVWDVQSDRLGPGGARRILVAFQGGAVGVYTGP